MVTAYNVAWFQRRADFENAVPCSMAKPVLAGSSQRPVWSGSSNTIHPRDQSPEGKAQPPLRPIGQTETACPVSTAWVRATLSEERKLPCNATRLFRFINPLMEGATMTSNTVITKTVVSSSISVKPRSPCSASALLHPSLTSLCMEGAVRLDHGERVTIRGRRQSLSAFSEMILCGGLQRGCRHHISASIRQRFWWRSPHRSYLSG